MRGVTRPGEDVLVRKADLFEVFGPELVEPDKLFYPPAGVSPADVIGRFSQLRHNHEEAAIVIVDGAFDVPQPNHDWYLRHTRLLGAKLFLEKIGAPVDRQNLVKIVGTGEVAVAVTLDADEKVRGKKGHQDDKGGVDRPVYPWKLRAERIAGLGMPLGRSIQRSVVDLVTVEGDSGHQGTPLESTLKLATFLTEHGLLDGLVVYGEHTDAVIQSLGSIVNTLVIPNKTNYSVDPTTGEPWSSSDFIRRIKGETKA